LCGGFVDNSGIQREPVDDQTDDRETELGAKSSVEACSSLGCLSPRASTDALLPSFQPDDDAGVTSPQPSPSAEYPPRNYPGSVPQFAARRNRSPRSDEVYPIPGHASYAGHSPRSEVTPPSLRRSSFSEQVTRSSPRSSNVVVEDLTISHPKLDRTFVETQQDQQNRSPNVGDGNFRREMIMKSKMNLLRVDTSLGGSVSRQSRDSAANHVS